MEPDTELPGALVFSNQYSLLNLPGGVAQLVRARGSYPRRRQFESAHRHQLSL